MIKGRAALCLVLALGGLAYAALYIIAFSPTPLHWDEIDYVNASKLGIAANALERGSLSIVDFVRLGLLKMTGDAQAIATFGSTLPNEAYDPFMLRHFHPPLPNYLWAAWGHFGETSGHWHRSMLVALVGLFAVFLGWFVKSGNHYALAAAAILFSAPVFAQTFSTLNYHAFHALVAVVYLLVFTRHLAQPSNYNALGLGVTGALLVLTLEMGLIVLALTVLALFVVRKSRQFFRLPIVLRVAAGFLLTVLLLWTGFFTKGGSFKAVLMYAYRLFARGGEEYAQVETGGFWFDFAFHNPLVLVWCLAGIFLTFHALYRRGLPKIYAAPLIVAVGYAVFMSPFVVAATYMVPAVAMLSVHTAIILGALYGRPHNRVANIGACTAAAAAVAAGFIADPIADVRNLANAKAGQMAQDVAVIHALADPHRPVLAVGAHVPAFFVPDLRFTDARPVTGSDPTLFARQNYGYVSLDAGLARSAYGAVLIPSHIDYPPATLHRLRSFGYERRQLNYFTIYAPSHGR